MVLWVVSKALLCYTF